MLPHSIHAAHETFGRQFGEPRSVERQRPACEAADKVAQKGSGASDDEISQLVSQVWRARADRYSEIRTAETAKLRKVEMSYIGG